MKCRASSSQKQIRQRFQILAIEACLAKSPNDFDLFVLPRMNSEMVGPMAPMGFFEEPPVQIWTFKDRVRRMGLRGIPMESESNGKSQ